MIQRFLLSLNPYSNGMKIEFLLFHCHHVAMSLNPYSNGMKIESHRSHAEERGIVLILILME